MKMKKGIFFGFLAIIAIFGTVLSASAATQTGIDIVNISDQPGNVVVEFYRSDGTSGGQASGSIAAFGSLNFYLPNLNQIQSGQYSARVSSDVPVAATVGLTDGTEQVGDDYLGTNTPDTTLTFPLVYRNYGSWNSQLVVQNATSSPQTVNIQFFKNGSTTANASDSASINAYSYAIFDLADAAYSGFGNDYGVAVVTGAGNLAGTALAIRDTGQGATLKAELTYRAFGSNQLGQELVAPLFYRNYGGFATGVNVVNRGGTATNVTVEFSSANGVAGGPWTFSKTNLQPGEGYTFYTPALAGLPNNLFGSATISSSATDIAAVVSHSRFAGGAQQAFAYEAPLTSTSSNCVALPIVHNRTTWKSGLNVINLGAGTASVTVDYASSNPQVGDASKTYSIPAGSPFNIYMPTDAATALNFYGGASFSSNQPIVVLATSANTAAGIARNYMGVNYACP